MKPCFGLLFLLIHGFAKSPLFGPCDHPGWFEEFKFYNSANNKNINIVKIFSERGLKTMTRKHFLITATIFILLIFIIFNLALQLKTAKQDAIDAREMELDSKKYEVQLMNITMYAPLSPGAVEGEDFSGDPSLTASGDEVVPGETAAAGPNIPFGTRIYVEGLGWRTVNDRGRLVGPNNIDLAVPTLEESIKFGKQQRLVILQLP